MPRVLDCLTVRIGIEVGQSNVKTDSLSCGFSLPYTFLVKAKLNVVPISSTDNPNSLNLFQLIEMQVASPPHLEASRLKPIGEGDSSPILRQLPSRCLIFNRTVGLMFLELGKTLQSLLAVLAVVVESERLQTKLVQQKLVEPSS
jgi:hypothetical protein